MSESLLKFVKTHPFWAALVIIFMVLPMVGAILHIVLKAFGRRGIDNLPTIPEDEPGEDGSPDNQDEANSKEDKKP
jgi:hypothetical protein